MNQQIADELRGGLGDPHHQLFLTSSAYFGSHPALQVIEQEPRRFK